MNTTSRHTLFTLAALLLWSTAVTAQTPATTPEPADSLVLPEGMQSQELDSLIYEWNVKTHLIMADSCNASGEIPEFDEQTYITRLSRMPCVIEMPYNAVVRRYIDQYCQRMRRSVSIFLGASNFYIPIFEEALESYQLPLELKYLPIIESALNPRATSRAGAVGLWQFMIATAKQYGLEVNSLVDERRDPIKSSFAAAQYLKDLYKMFGDWTLVIASYNCGPNNVLKAIKRAGGDTDYWKIYPYLPQETRGYVPAFIAANYAMEHYCQHNICPTTANLPQGTDTLVLNRNVYMEQIVDLCGIGMEQLQALNPQYRTTLIPGEAKPCTLKLPPTAVSAFLAAGDSIYTHRLSELSRRRRVVSVDEGKATPKGGARTVSVRKGDTLGAIARRNGVSVAQIKRLNGLKNDNLRVGQKLKLK